MKFDGFRAFADYASWAKSVHISEGYDWTQQLAQEFTQAARSFDRGRGPPKQSAAFNLRKVALLNVDQTCAGQGLLVPPVFAVLLGSLRVLREIQMAWAICDDVLVDVEESIIVWTLPVSKTDPKSEIVQAKVVVLVRPPVRRIVPVPCLCEVSERVAGSFLS